MNVRDVREGNIPFSDVKFFVEMNKMMGHVSRRLGEEGGKALEKAGKTKYSGKDSVKEVLSGMNKIVRNEKDIVEFIATERFSIIYAYNKYRLPDCVNTEDIPDSLWRFVCDNFASYVVEVCALRCLIELRKMKTESDLMIATSILLHLSDFRSDILHEPLAHNCKGNCGTKILQNTAERAAGNQEKFYDMLKGNALWSCCDDILDKLLAIVAKLNYYEIEGRDKLAVVELLLKCGARPGRQYAIGKYKNKTVLHSVAKYREKDVGIELAQALLFRCDERSINEFVNAADERGMTAIHLASGKGNVRLCELLIGHGASMTVQDDNAMTALHYAFEGGFDKDTTEIIKILVGRCDEQNIDEFVNARDKDGRSALHCASEKGNAQVCRMLLDHSAAVTYKEIQGKTALHYVFEGEIYKVMRTGKEIAQALLSSCDPEIICDFVNTTDESGRTALHGAAEKGNSLVCELLLEKDASVTPQDEKGMTALHYAFEGEIDRVRGVGTEIAKILLRRCDERNIDKFINAGDESERTALHRASEKSNAHICGLLVDHGASVIAKDKNGMTALHYAVKAGPISKDMQVGTEIAQVLLRKCDVENMPSFVNATDVGGKTALHCASKKGNAEICALLVDCGALITPQDKEGKTALHYALEGRTDKDTDVVTRIAEVLLRRCDKQNLNELIIKPDNSGRTPLHSASQTGNTHMCRLLLDLGASVTAKDKEDKTALHYVVEGLHHYDTSVGTKIAQDLLAKCDEQYIDQFVNAEDANGMSALHSASSKGNARICALLLDRGASVTARDKKGKTALYYAFEGDDKDIDVRTEIAETLLCRSDKRDIDKYINTEDESGRTDLHRASEKGNAYICKLLLDHGASLTARDKKSKTALHYAFEGIDRDIVVGTEIAEGLLHRCDNQIVYEFINGAEDENGRTALHCASEKGDACICALLVDLGALVTLQDKKGKTALHYAVESRNDKAIDALLKSSHVSFSLNLRDIEGSTPLDIALANKDSKSTAKFLLMSKESEAYLDEALPCIDNESTAKLLVNLKEPEAYFNKVNREQLLRNSLLLGSVDVVAKLFERGVRLPAGDRDEDGKTALHLAAMCDNESDALEIISLRIGKETRENCEGMLAKQDGRGRTVLHEAAFNGYNDLCQGLLELNSELIFTKDNNQRSPLHDVADGKYKGAALIKQLMKAYLKKVRPKGDLVDRRGLTPLHVAASLGKAQAVKVLLSNDKIKTEYVSRGDILSQTALHKAVKCGDVDTVEILLDHGAHPLKERDSDGRTALHNVVQAQITEHIKVKLAELLFNRCELKEDKSLLLWASAAGLGTAGNLIKHGALHDFLEKTKIMLSQDKSLEETFKGNLLKIAASRRNIEMTKELISRGYQIQDIRNTEWKDMLPKDNRDNVNEVLRQIDMITEQGNDKPTISDNLGRLDYAQGLAALFLNPYIKPPIAVGITGTWGMGKSSLMLQTECVLLATAAHIALLPSSKLSSSALQLPDITPWKISKKGKRKRGRIYKQIQQAERVNRCTFAALWDCIKSQVTPSCTKGSQEEFGNFLNELEEKFLKHHHHKYLKVFKALAAMDNSDITRPKEDPSAEENVHAVLTVQYSAWKYRNDTEALAGLAVEITKELEGIMSQAQWLNTCWRNAWIKNKYTLWIEFFCPPLLALVLAGSFTWIAWVVFGSEKLKEWGKVKYAWPPAAFVTILWTLSKSAMGILKPVSSQLMQYMSFPDHTDKLGYQERVISDICFLKDEIGRKAFWVFTVFAWVWKAFAALWDLIIGSCIISLIFPQGNREKAIQAPKIAPASGSNLRIIVFVDDLDRCEESVILQVLSAVNLVLGVCEISVVIGMDIRLIERAIINNYKDENSNTNESLEGKELADMYLQKIIQLPLDLPDPSEKESQKFLTAQLGGLENESVASTKGKDGVIKINKITDTGSSSTDGGDRTTVQQDNAGQHTITVERTEKIEHIATGPTNLLERNAPPESREEATSQTVDKSTITGDQEQSSSLLIRQMLFVRYSKGEEEAFLDFQKSATGYRKLPREWKRFLNYHRLVWYIFSVSNEAKTLDGWQVQLITWIFSCWEWRDNMNFVIEKWNEVGNIKTDAPSLLTVIEHLMDTKATSYETSQEARSQKSDNSMEKKLDALEKMLAELRKEMKDLKGLPSDQMKNEMEEIANQVSSDVKEERREMKEKMVGKGNGKNESIECIKEINEQRAEEKSGGNEEKWNKSWERMKSALQKYDVSMQGIQVFQRFRFHCTSGYLPPLGTHGK